MSPAQLGRPILVISLVQFQGEKGAGWLQPHHPLLCPSLLNFTPSLLSSEWQVAGNLLAWTAACQCPRGMLLDVLLGHSLQVLCDSLQQQNVCSAAGGSHKVGS